MIYIVLGLLGTAMGAVYLYGRGDFLLGGVIGLLLAAVIDQRNRLLAIEKRLAAMDKRFAGHFANQERSDTPPTAGTPEPTRSAAEETAEGWAASTPSTEPNHAFETPVASVSVSTTIADIPSLELELPDTALADPRSPIPEESGTQPPADSDGAGGSIHPWLFGGNLMVRVGVVVLLFGFAFLVKYASAHNLVPLEIRLAAAFTAGIGMLLLGWRLRGQRFGYAVTLQGGGIGVMYLTLFGAARLFHLVPMSLTFGLMIGLVVFSGILAVLQNAAAMAVLGAAGGFAAPVLLSTGSGSHVMLFSYYGLLNAGIFGIAWFKSWRWLNMLGFIFTFGIGSVWGVQYYRPRYFTSTEPFLILFFIFYLGICVLFALRQPPRLKGYVDGTLVFGVPLVVFTLQAGLVKAIPYGLAFSAVGLGLIYTGLATALWQRRDNGLRDLLEALLALGVVFGSLAIPLALSGSWAAVAWSLEGAGLVWIGLRQRRWMARAFGLLLQIGSGGMFMLGSDGGWSGVAVFNSRFLGGIVVGAAGLFCAFVLERYRERLHRREHPLAALTMVWGLLWWYGTGFNEIDRRLSRRHEWIGMLTYIGANSLAMGLLFRLLNWKAIRWPAMGLLPAMVLCFALLAGRYDVSHPFQGWWLVTWPSVFAVHFYLFRCVNTAWPERISVAWHVTGALLATGLLGWEAGWLLDRLAGGARVWSFIAWGGVPATAVSVLIRFGHRLDWPSDAWEAAYRRWLPLLLTVGLMAWTALGITRNGDPRPLPFLPLLNPLDLMQMLVFLTIITWAMGESREPVAPVKDIPLAILWGIPAVGVFFWLTAVVARTIHHYSYLPYDWEVMFRSNLFHAAISVLWGLLSLGCMAASNRFQRRGTWFVGAGLLSVVVVKLFVVDLSGSGSVHRIVSFLAVGVLMLVVGFFSPLPPAVQKGAHS
jgi:uncharacterized membrane protein